MNIMDWPMQRIMTLPDWAFGRRWMICLRALMTGAGPVFDISDTPLPNGFVIWQVSIAQRYASAASITIALATGDQLPANDAAYALLQPLMPQVVSPGGRLSEFDVLYLASQISNTLKQPVENLGRRLVGRFQRTVGTAVAAQCFLVISSLPREVPDWLVSDKGKSQ